MMPAFPPRSEIRGYRWLVRRSGLLKGKNSKASRHGMDPGKAGILAGVPF
jgi:hypothetical protein